MCSGSIVVEHSTCNNNIEGLNAATDIGREKKAKKINEMS